MEIGHCWGLSLFFSEARTLLGPAALLQHCYATTHMTKASWTACPCLSLIEYIAEDMLSLWSIGRQQQNVNTVSSELAFHCNVRCPAFWKRNAERQKARLDMEVHGAGQRQGANLKLLVKGSKDGLPLSDLQLSHLLLHGCHLSSHCIVLLPCIIQTPGMLPQHLHSMHLHSMLLH